MLVTEQRSDVRTDPNAELRRYALEAFVAHGYEGASLQQIAERAGYTKANVLYHFGSKVGLLEQAIAPAIEAFERFLHSWSELDDVEGVRSLVDPFVALLLEHRLAVNLFLVRGSALEGIPSVDRATELVHELSVRIAGATTDPTAYLRTTIALGGAAYCLANPYQDDGVELDSPEFRDLLARTLTAILLTRPDAADADREVAARDAAAMTPIMNALSRD